MLYLLQQLWPAALFLGLAYLSGRHLERLFLHRVPLGRLRSLARWFLGFAFWILVVYSLAALGILGRPALALVAALVVLLGSAVWRRRRRDSEGRRPRDRTEPGSLITRPGWICLALLLLADALLAAGPTVSWDAEVYHLTLPRLFLEHGGFRPAPFLVYGHWPLGGEMLYTAVLGFGGPIASTYPAAKLLHFAFGALTLHALNRVARRFGKPWCGLLAGALFVAAPVVVEELRVAYVELIYAFFLLGAVLFAELGLRHRACRPALGLAGLCAGVIAGLKVSGFLAPVALGGALLGYGLRRRIGLRNLIRSLGLFTLPAVLAALPWPLRTWWETGNPVYPFLYATFGGPHWSAALGEQFAAWQRGIGMGRELLDYLLLPWRVILEGGRGYDHFDGELGRYWILLIPLALVALFRGRLGGLSRLSLTVSGLYFCLWAASSQQMRFLVPILPLLGLAGAEGILRLAPRRGSLNKLGPAAALLTVALVFQAHLPLLVPALLRAQTYFRDPPAQILAGARPEVFGIVDRLPATARILMLHTNRGLFCEREFLADSFFEASQIRHWLAGTDVQGVARRLAGARVSHVLLNLHPRGTAYPEALGRLLTDPRRARPVYQDDDFLLMQLAPPTAQPANLGAHRKENEP